MPASRSQLVWLADGCKPAGSTPALIEKGPLADSLVIPRQPSAKHPLAAALCSASFKVPYSVPETAVQQYSIRYLPTWAEPTQAHGATVVVGDAVADVDEGVNDVVVSLEVVSDFVLEMEDVGVI